jgi:hypothetical protein
MLVPTWVLVSIGARHVAGPMRVHVLRLLLLRVRVWVLVLLLALLGGPLMAVRQLWQVLLGTCLHFTVHKVVILTRYTYGRHSMSPIHRQGHAICNSCVDRHADTLDAHQKPQSVRKIASV